MSSTVSVIVQTPYILADDEGHTLVPNGEIFEVKMSERIQTYIDLGQLSLVPSPEVPVTEPEVLTTTETPAKKTRTSAEKQENLNG